MSKRKRIRTEVKTPLIPKTLARTIAGGTIAASMGATDSEVELVQKAIGNGYARKIEVYATDEDGTAVSKMQLAFEDDCSGEVMMDLNSGRPGIDEYDEGVGAMVRNARDFVERKGLDADVRIEFREDIYDDPVKLARVRAELGTGPAEVPEYGPEYEEREVIHIEPERDAGASVGWFERFWRKD